ncbi:DUF1189 domain-containing protein [Clostridium sp. C8-1-8]|uniref:DUF1189 domain-containing protein n=1 Tax=Clostridium sp. C8-1-8 TaxID=2698831 RepID=UPI001367FC03|nr:DUF1189 domain-containing protein [Clostridium sp. C8-1-8]
MTKKDRFFKKFIKSIVDVKYYVNFNKETLGRAFMYLFLMSLLLGTLNSIKPMYSGITGVGKAVKELDKNSVDFKLENGVLNVSNSPFTYEDGDTYIIVDTTKNASEFDKSSIKSNEKSTMYIFKDKIIIEQDFKDTQEIKYSDLGNVTFTKADLIHLMGWVKIFVAIIIPLWIIGMFIGHMFSALIVAVIGLLINIFIKAKVDFENLYKLAIYSLTLPTIVDILRGAFGLNVPHFYKIYILITLIYLGLALKAIKDDNNRMELSEL